MAMTPEAAQEFRESALLLSAPELKGMMGDDPEEDAIINSILGAGKQVEVPGLPEVSGDADDADDDQDDEDQDDDEEEGSGDPTQDMADAAAAEHAAETTEPAAEAAPVVDFTAPALDLSGIDADYKAQLDTLKAEKKALTAKLMAGEIEADEYSDLEEKNTDARDLLREQQGLQKQWLTDVHNFRVQAAKTSGVNYFEDTEKFEAFDGWVQRLGSNPANNDKSPKWFLEQAHKKVLVEFEITPPPAKTAEIPQKNVADGKKVAPKTARTPNLSAIPPTLGGLPAAAPATGGDGGEFAHLDKLSGMAWEQAIARMTPEQRDRWSRQ